MTTTSSRAIRNGAARYDLHGLVDIQVDASVAQAVVSGVEFQVGHFRSTPSQGAATLRLLPFDARPRAAPEDNVFFHRERGIPRRLWESPARRVAVAATKEGFDVFADDAAYMFNFFVNALLLRSDACMVHAGGLVNPRGEAILFPGPGGVGKTALVTELVRDHGFQLLGDDVVALSATGECLAYPRHFILKEYHADQFPAEVRAARGARKGWTGRLRRFAGDNAPFRGLVKEILRRSGRRPPWVDRWGGSVPEWLAAVPIERLFGRDKIAHRAPLARVLFLERFGGPAFRCRTIDPGSLRQRLYSIMQHEWGAYHKDVFSLGALEILDPAALSTATTEVLDRALARRPSQIMQVPQGAAVADLAHQVVECLANEPMAEVHA